MVSAKNLKLFCLLLFHLLISIPVAGAGFAWNITRNASSATIIFSEELAIESLMLPTEASRLWGPGVSCRAATLQLADRSFIASAQPGQKELVFHLEGLFTDRILVRPAYLEKADQPEGSGSILLEAVPAQTRRIESEIESLTRQVIDFQKQNNCFSCHTLFPLALTINEAARRGLSIASSSIEVLSDSLTAMQRADGRYYFANQPEYGEVSTSLCAGGAMALLVRFDRRLLLNLVRISRLFPNWIDDESDLKSDFFFRPLFIGKPTSAMFEALILAALYYFRPVITGEKADEELRQRLIRLNARFKIDIEDSAAQNLLLLVALPYIGQFSDEMRAPLFKSVLEAQRTDPMLSRASSAALAALFFDRMGNKNGLQQLRLLQTTDKTLSERLWLCFIKVMQHQP